ncbi:Transmembrane protein 183 [Frankliniella fusca]|uniref:Transmembrane protein 183 n=1 Tax=Frankliniella fusca TaxID=407009 RepID=A0AAE1HAV4_9NEOP|nr:Transmembrane protein 183 [Frankliniella fusca]
MRRLAMPYQATRPFQNNKLQSQPGTEGHPDHPAWAGLGWAGQVEVSIYDYADAKVIGRKGRLSKSVATSISAVEILAKGGSCGGLRWEQRQRRLEEGDAVEDFDLKGRTTVFVEDSDSSKPYLILPMDIWFAIGEHIPPEGVKAFASICRSTQKVTYSARFWFALYRRYYKKSDLQLLPVRLRPQNMTICGLKANVIRSLFFMYPPFIERLKPRIGRECDLQPILRRKCINTWYTHKGKVWTYWFKLKQINVRKGRCQSLYSLSNKKLLEMEREISINEEQFSKVLQVTSLQYLPLPAVHGLTLKRALITVSQDMMANKLTLAFDNHDIVVDPATNVQILDWWHPQYPHATYQEGRKSLNSFIYDKDRNDSLGVTIDHWYDD